MESLKYTVIKTRRQYNRYCAMLEQLLQSKLPSKHKTDEIELLTFLIEKWDEDHNTFADVDPVTVLKSLMEDHQLQPKDLADILQVSKGLVSDILHYKKGLSKEVIRALAAHFKVSQEVFNRPYNLISPMNAHLRNARVMNTRKNLAKVP